MFARFGYTWFTGEYNLNIFGIRSNSNSSVAFDDLLCVAYQHGGKDMIYLCDCTLNPGTYWLQNLMDKGGAAIIKEGNYRGLFKKGYYLGKPSLLQVGLITVYRDGNRDSFIDLGGLQTTGNYGIFMHEHHQGVNEAKEIGKSSAGCIVPKRNSDFYAVIDLCDKQIPIWGNSFSFSLFTENDLKTFNV